ncbi:energy-coupling factor transporter ATPase [Metamycoplasma hyosynoviae]|uniref:Energy-coupling factor transporter ATPase n=1 Tax=Metamycoplasma hyosynoviae TaxID=29559 RepID=A0A063YB77_9BACT|nr:energy-coupling factor transporter ATPase [Metamycoplasma hyosynoviae]KDE42415.1 transporter [Metamycoplasma hyosynoviae]MDC8918951.1 energy-coupling factor transporter ATPase [Metamycoplasma hyosynoviae]MDC8920384.1 energy-coupling factor transporter ATPase [Metamycoplasma hyosynoviae]MDD1358730.1 energy-coupling factor transporter ATPase [Metamycoplasma hyosynoviae]MDD1361486.1 energy-coupling factor transporter ATPase [Metamycoplasma hyosynoviae]
MIEIKNLYFKYPGAEKYALDDINLDIETGKYIAILGHNGSGKSTFSKLLSAIYKASSGKIIVDGVEINPENISEIRRMIGIVFQNPDNQFIGSTVEDDIAFGLENKKLDYQTMRKIVVKYATAVGMENYLEREPQNLSGGQKQRVAIASTLALDPQVIIFDEITSMLDPRGRVDIYKIIHNLHKSTNKTLISITHDMDEALLADILIVFSGGKVIAKGSPIEILNNKEIIEIAKIDSPFIYKLSEKIKGVKPTYDEDALIEELCKLK